MKKSRPRQSSLFWALLAVNAAVCLQARAARSAPDQFYIPRLIHRVAQWRSLLPAVKAAALPAAIKVIHGGHLYIGGPQTSFVDEALVRSGGLMLIRQYGLRTRLAPDDTMLAACTSSQPSSRLEALLKTAARAGAAVVLFGDGAAGPWRHAFPAVRFLPPRPFTAVPAGTSLQLACVSNVIGLWTWTAEFVSACVEHGKMPNMYPSYWRPGGRARDTKLAAHPFQPQITLTAGTARHLGRRYLRGVTQALRNVWIHDHRGFVRAARLIRLAHASGHVIRVVHEAHMFPAEMMTPQNPAWFTNARPGAHPTAQDVAIVIGYQQFNRSLMTSIAHNGSACILTCSSRPPGWFLAGSRTVYLNPYWRIDDALLRLKGYDVRILPISGIMQSAIYWQLVELSAYDRVAACRQ